ncbi:hypothetical protein Goshw_029272 [Gossypium schwendimanii]|uniref:Uncharacterized protein n=1 Tax=Gossypium schwendimanii TaxID=34291 RepID=A0A7J9M8N5_GOSSC|nr:hypothetical protein [Gossypium schwendimanii]
MGFDKVIIQGDSRTFTKKLQNLEYDRLVIGAHSFKRTTLIISMVWGTESGERKGVIRAPRNSENGGIWGKRIKIEILWLPGPSTSKDSATQ